MANKKKDYKDLSLTLYDRINLVAFLPDKGSRHKIGLIEDIKEEVKVTDEEITKYKIHFFDNGRIHIEKFKEATSDESVQEYSFVNEKFRIIKDAFKKADSEESIPANKHVMKLYDKVMKNE